MKGPRSKRCGLRYEVASGSETVKFTAGTHECEIIKPGASSRCLQREGDRSWARYVRGRTDFQVDIYMDGPILERRFQFV